MFPIGDYAMMRRRQAEYERFIQAAKLQQPRKGKFHRKGATWLGIHLVRWGQKLEHFGTFGENSLHLRFQHKHDSCYTR